MSGRTIDTCRVCGDEWRTTRDNLIHDRYEHYRGHIPPEDPARLSGPEIGPEYIYQSKYTEGPARVTVIERSYVWGPGDPSYRGGYRHYDWSVIRFRDPVDGHGLVVNDTDLEPVA